MIKRDQAALPDSELATGTRQAILDIMDAAGHYPGTRTAILSAIEEGVRRAFTDWLATNEPFILDDQGIPLSLVALMGGKPKADHDPV